MKYFPGTLSDVYGKLIETLKVSEEVGNTREITNCILEFTNPSNKQLYFPYRKISTSYADAELRWYWSSDNSCETIGKHAKMWLAISDDGLTSNSAYGYIIHKKYHIDQLKLVIECLKTDKNTRRAVLNISDPTIDKLNTKDMQCTIAIQFLIRNNNLEMTVYMRSNDVYFGLPYDYIYFTSLGNYVASKVNCEFTKYTHVVTSMHMYNRDVEKFIEHNQIVSIDYDKIIGECYEK